MKTILVELTKAAIKTFIQIFRRGAALCALASLFLAVIPTSSNAQTDPRCSNNGGPYQCIKANIIFASQVGAGYHRTGDLACQASTGNADAKYWANFPNLGTGCQYDPYGTGTKYFYQNWVLPIQFCDPWNGFPGVKSESPVSGWYDETDTSEDNRGRFWCAYKKPPQTIPPETEAKFCSAAGASAGQPILPATGEKVLSQADYSGVGPSPLNLTRSYRSSRVVSGLIGYTGPANQGTFNPGLGQPWSHNHAHYLAVTGTTGTSGSTAKVMLGDGTVRAFTYSNTTASYQPDNSADSLAVNASGLVYKRQDDDTTWQFNAAGQLQTITQRNGWTTTYNYSTAATPVSVAPAAGLLISVNNQFGRAINFTYNATSQLIGVTTPDGQTTSYSYDGAANTARLVTITYPGNAARTYLYENTTFPQLLTGITDEAGNRYETLAYDSQGRGISTELAGGANKYTIAYGASSAAATVVTDPLGTARNYNYGISKGKLAVTGANLPSGSGGSDAASRIQDTNGFVTQETDFLGIQTLYTWDVSRRLPLATTQAAGRPEAQTTNTQWHPTLRLPVLVTEAGRTTASAYDAQGNKLSETIADTATGQARTWAWTYVASGNGAGLVATSTDPKGGITNYSYNAQGLLISMTNPLGHVSTYSYDTAGRLSNQTEPNGLATSYTYDARARLLTASTGSGVNLETTSYSYHPTGQLATAALPSGYSASYSYDAAQRLTSATDNRGNRISYTLDAMGNRVREEVKDQNNTLALATGKVINQLNRVSSVQGAANQTTALSYDANGQPISQTDPLNQTTAQTLDGLKRPVATTFADSAVASQSYNQLDQLTNVTDPKGIATSYTRNAFGEVMQETSPDIGSMSYQRNAAGEVIGSTDAKGNSTSITRDALGRPLTVTRTSPASTGAAHITTYTWDTAGLLGTGAQTGYLAKLQDPSGSTSYGRDSFGRITAKLQIVNDNPASPSSFKTSYSYDKGQLVSITYPSGMKVIYSRSASGQVTGISTQVAGRNKPVTAFATAISYTALGQPKSWSWTSGDTASRSFDSDGRMVSNEFAAYTYDAASRITGITQSLWASRTVTQVIGTGTAVVTERYLTPLSWQASYDRRNRVTGFDRLGSSTGFTYDANSNRLSSIDKTTSDTDLDGQFDADDFSQTSSQNSNLDAASNKLLGFTQTITKIRGTRTLATTNSAVNYSLDQNGSLTSDGLRSFDYDESNRLSKIKITKDGEAASITYLHNALGQRVFKGEPKLDTALPNESTLGATYIDWLKKNFQWLFTAAQANTSVGTAYSYADAGQTGLPEWALLGEYDNGSAAGKGRSEYIWLPTEGGSATPVGMFRNGRFFAVHADHLGTPRLLTNDTNTPVWQWPYSAFGNNKPTGILKATANPRGAITNNPVLLRATGATEFNLRFPGQYADDEAGSFYNYFRSYQPGQGRYTQGDPIGLAGGLNRYAYVNGNPLSMTDPEGLMGRGGQPTRTGPVGPGTGAVNGSVGGGGSFHLPIGIGLGIDGGVATDTTGNICLYSMVCYTVGPPGLSGSLGGVTSVGSGPLSTGVTDYQGACWSGGAGLAGSASVLFGNDGSAQVGRGLAGIGGGGSVAYQSCRQMLVCRKN